MFPRCHPDFEIGMTGDICVQRRIGLATKSIMFAEIIGFDRRGN